MPVTNGRAPPLTPAERAVVSSFGDWTTFMQTYGLKPWDADDIEEAHRIVQQMARMDEEEQMARAKQQGKQAK